MAFNTKAALVSICFVHFAYFLKISAHTLHGQYLATLPLLSKAPYSLSCSTLQSQALPISPPKEKTLLSPKHSDAHYLLAAVSRTAECSCLPIPLPTSKTILLLQEAAHARLNLPEASSFMDLHIIIHILKNNSPRCF